MRRGLWLAIAIFAALLPDGGGAQTLGWSCQPKCLDTGVNWDGRTSYLFKGDQYVAFTGDEPDDYYPRPIAGNWRQFPQSWSSGIDAAVKWENGTIYFFKGAEYIRYDVAADGSARVAPVRPIAGHWTGFPASWSSGIDAGVNWGDGKVYFFKGGEYLRFDIAADKVDDGYPQPIEGNWQGFPQSWSSGIDAAINWGNGAIYFFKGDRYIRYNRGPGERSSFSGLRSVPGNWTVFAEPQRADLNETFVTTQVTVRGFNQHTRSGPMILTYYRPNGAGPFPTVIYSHGRRPNNREWPARRRESAIAEAWLRRGFAFFIATRLGYGGTGLDPDIERVGGCANAQYEPGADAVVTQTLAAANYARTLPFVDRSRIVLVGNSTGGLAMILASSLPMPEGVIAALNYAGGAGGGVLGAGHPCNEPDIRRLIANSGRAARVPMLWLYAKNDEFWGPDLPRQWYANYIKNGGKAEFREFDRGGHNIVSHTDDWGSAVDAYLAKLGISSKSSEP